MFVTWSFSSLVARIDRNEALVVVPKKLPVTKKLIRCALEQNDLFKNAPRRQIKAE